MATRDRQRYMLQTIFSFFLGLMVLAFIGVGVNTALPNPMEDFYGDQPTAEVQALYDQRANVEKRAMADNDLSAEEQKELDTLDSRIALAEKRGSAESQRKYQEAEAKRKTWARDTSIVLIIFATLVMGISLIRSEQLRLISNGLLLGGLFTMLYGTGWSIFSGDDWIRFGVISFALVITVVLGYLKFVRERAAAVAAGEAGMPPGEAPLDDAAYADLRQRVARLEARAAAAAAAFGIEEPHARAED